MEYGFTIDPDNKAYPDADKWMWDYCTYLGTWSDPFNGQQYDLGILINQNNIGDYKVKSLWYSEASVHGNEPGDYYSGRLVQLTDSCWDGRQREVVRRARLLNIIHKDWTEDNVGK